MRWRLDLQYDGSDFFGWQVQPETRTVQGVLEEKLTLLNSGNHVEVVGCGRTDTGVHAHHYVAHTDFHFHDTPEQLVWKLNNMLPQGVAILHAQQTHPHFHARFDATSRTYRYFIHRKKNPFKVHHSYYFQPELQVEKMNEACQHLLGTHDFTSFSKLHTDVHTNLCTVTHAHWQAVDDGYVFEVTANRFLRNMVRALVGTLLEVGLETYSPDHIRQVMDIQDRNAAGRSVPAQGLFLWEIHY